MHIGLGRKFATLFSMEFSRRGGGKLTKGVIQSANNLKTLELVVKLQTTLD